MGGLGRVVGDHAGAVGTGVYPVVRGGQKDHDGRVALVRPLGDRFVVRPLEAPIVARAGGLLRVRPDEAMFPETMLDLGEAVAMRWAGRL